VLDCYRLTNDFPRHEIFGLTAQMRRAAISVPAKIAEGFRKRSSAEKLHFCNIAQGSLEKSRYYLILTKDLEYGDVNPQRSQLVEVSRLLERYMQTIRAHS
jgi:four helix bundle protein